MNISTVQLNRCLTRCANKRTTRSIFSAVVLLLMSVGAAAEVPNVFQAGEAASAQAVNVVVN